MDCAGGRPDRSARRKMRNAPSAAPEPFAIKRRRRGSSRPHAASGWLARRDPVAILAAEFLCASSRSTPVRPPSSTTARPATSEATPHDILTSGHRARKRGARRVEVEHEPGSSLAASRSFRGARGVQPNPKACRRKCVALTRPSSVHWRRTSATYPEPRRSGSSLSF